MRILSVNGNPLLNVKHQDAVNVLRGAGSQIEMLVCDGYDPKEVERLRGEGKLPDKIQEILSNSEEAAAAEAAASTKKMQPSTTTVTSSSGDVCTQPSGPVLEKKVLNNKPSVDKVLEVVKAAEHLVAPSSPDLSNSRPASTISVPPSSPGYDVKKTTIVMKGHSLTSPGLGGHKVLVDHENESSHTENLQPKPRSHIHSVEDATYANLGEINHTTYEQKSSERGCNSVDLKFMDEPNENGGGLETKNPIFNGGNMDKASLPPLPPNYPSDGRSVPTHLNFRGRKNEEVMNNSTSPPVPTPRTSLSSPIVDRSPSFPADEVSTANIANINGGWGSLV